MKTFRKFKRGRCRQTMHMPLIGNPLMSNPLFTGVKPTQMTGKPVIGKPGVGATQTFVTIGAFDTQAEAENVYKYMHTKFFQAMLSLGKCTQDAAPYAYRFVPLQDFTNESDIDWSKDLANIDAQLYYKYGLDFGERMFIETFYKYRSDYDDDKYFEGSALAANVNRGAGSKQRRRSVRVRDLW